MSISENSTRIIVTVSKDMKKQIDKLAEIEKRTVSNLCAKILSDYLDRIKDGE